MWDCQQCGCQAIAASLTYCPMCFKERDMPKVTAGGPSNEWEPSEPVVEAPVVEQPVVEPVPEPVVIETPVVEPVPAVAPGPEPAPVVVD